MIVGKNIGLCLQRGCKSCNSFWKAEADESCPIAELHALADPDPKPGRRQSGKTERILRKAGEVLNRGEVAIIICANFNVRNHIRAYFSNRHLGIPSSQFNIRNFITTVEDRFEMDIGRRGTIFTDEVHPEFVFQRVMPYLNDYVWGGGVYSE
jgi:hypothetical protein